MTGSDSERPLWRAKSPVGVAVILFCGIVVWLAFLGVYLNDGPRMHYTSFITGTLLIATATLSLARDGVPRK